MIAKGWCKMKDHVGKKLILLATILLPLTSYQCNALPDPMPGPLGAAADSGVAEFKHDSRAPKQADMDHANNRFHDLMFNPPAGDAGVIELGDGDVSDLGDGFMEGGADAGMDTLAADSNLADIFVTDSDLTDTLAADVMLDQDSLDDHGTDYSVR